MQERDFNTALPPPLADLVERVTRGTRLWASEKRDVRAELQNHFLEGLHELRLEGLPLDVSIELLRENFGNPDVTAKLIRRGKKRGRSMFWKVGMSIAMTAFATAAAGGGYAAYLAWATPNPTVDYVKVLNEPIEKTPVDERAWPLLRDSLLRFQPMPASLSALNPASLTPGSADWAAVEAWLAVNRPLVSSLHEAVMKPVYGFVYGGSDTTEFLKTLAELRPGSEDIRRAPESDDPLEPRMIGILLPHLAEVRKVAWFLVLNSRDQASDGLHVAMWQSLDLCHRLGAKLLEGRTLIEQLVGAAIMRIACEEARRVITERDGMLQGDELQFIGSSLLMTMDLAEINPSLDGEMLTMEDVIQYVFTDDGNGNGRLIPSQYHRLLKMGIAPAAPGGLSVDAGETQLLALAAMHADRADTLQTYRRLWAELNRYRSLPLYDPERARAERMVQQFANGPEARKYELITTLIPSLNHADQLIRECRMETAATRAVIAMAGFKSEHGRWPNTIDELAGRISEAPVDEFSGKPIVLSSTKDGMPIFYSIWRDLKDDGGSAAEVTDRMRGDGEYKTTADRVFFPLARE